MSNFDQIGRGHPGSPLQDLSRQAKFSIELGEGASKQPFFLVKHGGMHSPMGPDDRPAVVADNVGAALRRFGSLKIAAATGSTDEVVRS